MQGWGEGCSGRATGQRPRARRCCSVPFPPAHAGFERERAGPGGAAAAYKRRPRPWACLPIRLRVQDVPHRVGVAENHAEVPALSVPGQASVVEERAPVRECERDVVAPACVSRNPSGAATEVLSDAVEQLGV